MGGELVTYFLAGPRAASTEGSHRLLDWMRTQKGQVAFKEVLADHPGMVPLVLPDVFAFFDSVGVLPVSLPQAPRTGRASRTERVHQGFVAGSWFDLSGRRVFRVPVPKAELLGD